MKICNVCSSKNEDDARFCFSCGASLATASVSEPPKQPSAGEQFEGQCAQTTGVPLYDALTQEPVAQVQEKDNGKIIPGILGAILFSLGGVLAYCVLYQLGIIAGLACLLMFVLASMGYDKFAGTKGKNSPVGNAVSFILVIVMILFAEYVSMGISIFIEMNGDGYTLIDSFSMIPYLLEYDDVREAFVGDLAFAYIFGIIAAAASLIKTKKSKKKENK